MTWLDVLIVLILIGAAITGFRKLGGSGRAGALLGLLVGAGLCAGFGIRLAAFGTDPSSRQVLFWVGVVAGLLLGSIIGGFLGGLLSRVLAAGRLTIVDRALGALAGVAGALLVLWLLVTVVPVLLGPGPLEPINAVITTLGGHSTFLEAFGNSLPTTAADVQRLLTGTPSA
ncbi:CvpA family protein [Pseudonocardia endophytica]|uniref:Colicin V production protein n=1 Tax=Pseudonocardia endophytica TaxID=401976 RepID=A0A4R1I2M5_PSEEN|nr:CvpA family protein [Pseudonocardia endophytica]TCK27875.1 colicin V production protein [Pseudonocardia endophytica]